MATITQLRDRIKRRLARSSATNLNTLILDEMTHVQVEILEAEPFLPSFLKTTFSFTMTGSHYAISLVPTTVPNIPGFIRPVNDTEENPALHYLLSGYYTPIKRYDSLAQLKQIAGDGLDRGDVPLGYFWNGDPLGTLQVRPQTNSDVAYHLSYYRHDPNTANSPDGNGNTLWSQHAADVLMHQTGLEVATNLRDKDAIAYFGAKLPVAIRRMQTQKVAQDMADLDLSMGD